MPETLADGTTYHTVPEVAKLLRVTPQTIRNRIKEGYYPGAQKPGKGWLIPDAEVMNSLNKRYGDKP